MTPPRTISILTAAVLSFGAVGLTAEAANAGAKGSIKVHLLAVGTPQKGVKLCATAKAAPKTSAVKGKCHKTNKHGYATLANVPKGKWYVTVFSGKMPAQSSEHKVKVNAGKTTSYTFNERVG